MAENTTLTRTTHGQESQPHGYPPNEPKPQGSSKAWVWLIVLVVVIGAGYYMYRQYQTMQSAQQQQRGRNQNRAVPVNVTTAKKSDMAVYVEALGTVTPIYTVTVTSRVQGAITNIYYKEGQMVHKGDPLIDIDPQPYQAQLTQVEGMLARDQALLGEARIDLDRYQTAYSRNAIAKQQLDDQTQLVLQDEGTVKNDEGQVENARVNLAYCHITSPIDGRVGLRLVDLGNIVQANSTTGLVVITQLQPITVIFSVAEDYLPQIQAQTKGGRALNVDALDRTQETKVAAGTLLTIDNQIDTTTGTVKLRAQFPNSDGSLFPNQFVNARLLVQTEKDDTVVPSAAIQRNAQGAFVYVIGSDGKATVRTVTTGVIDNNETAVKGVNPGETVASNGFDKLQDGVTVAVAGPNGEGRGRGGRGGRGGNNANAENTSPGDQTP
jgi:multidrug efflux system membrane fusion protein